MEGGMNAPQLKLTGADGTSEPQPVAQAKLPVVIPQTEESTSEFNWIEDADDIILPEQRAVAVYWNKQGSLIIRQEKAWCDEDDQFVVVEKANVNVFIDRLTEVLGIPSVGKKRQ
jgi:hypothetical protein